MSKVAFTVDDVCTVVVEEDKLVLATELIKHFKCQWQAMAKDAMEKEGKQVSSERYVSALLNSLKIENTVGKNIPEAACKVLSDMPGATEKTLTDMGKPAVLSGDDQTTDKTPQPKTEPKTAAGAPAPIGRDTKKPEI